MDAQIPLPDPPRCLLSVAVLVLLAAAAGAGIVSTHLWIAPFDLGSVGPGFGPLPGGGGSSGLAGQHGGWGAVPHGPASRRWTA